MLATEDGARRSSRASRARERRGWRREALPFRRDRNDAVRRRKNCIMAFSLLVGRPLTPGGLTQEQLHSPRDVSPGATVFSTFDEPASAPPAACRGQAARGALKGRPRARIPFWEYVLS